MESYGGLYEDLSLFNGDLLLEDVNEQLPASPPPLLKAGQDGGLFTTAPIIEAVSRKEASVHTILAHPQNGSKELGLADLLAVSPTQDLPDPFSSSSAWMDTNTDLLDLLTDDYQQQAFINQQQQQQATMDEILYPDSPEAAVVPHLTEMSSNLESLDMIQNLLGDFYVVAPAVSMDNRELDLMVYNSEPPTDAEIDILEELNEAGLEELLAVDSSTASMLDEPILSPVSADDVESLLSSNPPTPTHNMSLSSLFSSFTDSSFTVASDEDTSDWGSPGPLRPHKEKAQAAAPYEKPSSSRSKSKTADRRERKKEQNRTAALKYREKKRSEGDVKKTECELLEDRNNELKEKVDSMTREIKYLKDLMADVYKARAKAKKIGGAC